MVPNTGFSGDLLIPLIGPGVNILNTQNGKSLGNSRQKSVSGPVQTVHVHHSQAFQGSAMAEN